MPRRLLRELSTRRAAGDGGGHEYVSRRLSVCRLAERMGEQEVRIRRPSHAQRTSPFASQLPLIAVLAGGDADLSLEHLVQALNGAEADIVGDRG